MKNHDEILELIAEIEKNMQVLSEIEGFLDQVENKDLKSLGKTRSTAFIIAGIIESYYTCLETLFLRISQFFDNNLDPRKWHRELLHKMRLAINGIRSAVITDNTFTLLDELLRFRHFKRYYYHIDYDWDRLDFLVMKLKQVKPMLRADLGSFLEFLRSV
jgi:hypothetical protein